MRRIDLHPKKKLRNPARHLRSLRKWTDEFARLQWADYRKFSDRRHLNWRIPIHSKLISEPHTTPEIQAAVIQSLVNAAANLQDALPADCGHMRVAALIEYPCLFNSEVTLFISPDYFETFNPSATVTYKSTRTEDFQTDIEPSRVNIIEKFAIRLPAGSSAGGYLVRTIDFECPESNREYESWVVALPEKPALA